MLKEIKIYLFSIGILLLTGCTQNEMSNLQNPISVSNSDDETLSNSNESAGNFDRALSTPVSLSGTTYYVCVSASSCGSSEWATGVDSTASLQGKSKKKPFKSIDYAENQAKPGDLIIVGSGIYKSLSTEYKYAILYLKKSGASGKPISIKSEKKWGAILDATGIDQAVMLNCQYSTAYIRIDGFEIRNARYVGVNSKDLNAAPWTSCSNIELTNMKIHHFGRVGIALENAKNSLIASNLIYATTTDTSTHNHYHGIYISDLTNDILMKNNIIYGIKAGWPIHIYDGHGKGPANNHKVINNTLINDNPYRGGGIVMYGIGHVIRNNLIYNRTRILADYPSAISENTNISSTGTIIQNNMTNMKVLCMKGCRGASSITGNILNITTLATDFVSLSGLNFQLKSIAKAVNKGTMTGFGTRSGAPTDDFLNKKRVIGSSVDIGAHENY